MPVDRDRGPLGSVNQQGIDRHDARKFRLRRVPWTRRSGYQPWGCQPSPRCFAKAHDISLDLASPVVQLAERVLVFPVLYRVE
jgi:hypothetical protein